MVVRGEKQNRQATPSVIERRERDARALALRKAGATFGEIGKALGVTNATAYRMCQRVISHLSDEDADFMRDLMYERMEEYHRRLIEISLQFVPVLHQGQPVFVELQDGRRVQLRDRGPEVTAIMASLRVQESMRKMLGLDAAQRFEHTGADGGPITVQQREQHQEAVLGRISYLKEVASGGFADTPEDG